MKRLSLSKLFISAVIAGVLVVAGSLPVRTPEKVEAATASELMAQRASLQKKIAANNAKAAALAKEADGLKKKIGQFDVEIEHVDLEIQDINLKIKDLGVQLDKAQKELDRQKELLRVSLIALYKKGDASSLELLVGSQSFSQFINEQDYLERLKEGIQVSAEMVIELKQQIKDRQDEQKELLEAQKAARQVIANMRSERAELLRQTEGKEAKYRAASAAQQAELRKAEQALAAMLSSGSFVSLGPISKGDIVGRVGNTGCSTGPHLHLEVRNSNGAAINPMAFLGGSWMYPVDPVIISTHFGQNYGYGVHEGMDFEGVGAPVRAVDSGNVIARGWSQNQAILGGSSAYGYVVVIQHFNGHFSVYAHMTPPGASSYSGSYCPWW